MERSVYGTVGKVTAPVDKINVGIWTSVRVWFWWELSSICSNFEQASRANRRARFPRWVYAGRDPLDILSVTFNGCAWAWECEQGSRGGGFSLYTCFASLVSTMCGKLLAGCRYNSSSNNNNNRTTQTHLWAWEFFTPSDKSCPGKQKLAEGRTV